MDSRNYATVQLEEVAVDENAKLANYENGAALLEKILIVGFILCILDFADLKSRKKHLDQIHCI